MKIRSLSPALKKRIPFLLSRVIEVPESPGCYVLATIEDEVLYIGKTNSLHRRIQEHLDDSRMTQMTTSGLAVWFYFGSWPTTDIDIVETTLLFNYKAFHGHWPPLNRAGP